MFAVEPGGEHGGDEELRPIGVGAGIGHGEQKGAVVLELEVLVGKLCAIDRLAAGAVVVGEVAPLEHEVGDDAVEGATLVAEPVLMGAKGPEVFGRLGGLLGFQTHDNAACGNVINRDVEENVFVRHCVWLSKGKGLKTGTEHRLATTYVA